MSDPARRSAGLFPCHFMNLLKYLVFGDVATSHRFSTRDLDKGASDLSLLLGLELKVKPP